MSNKMWRMAKYKFVYIHVLKKSLFIFFRRIVKARKVDDAQCDCRVYKGWVLISFYCKYSVS